MKSTIRIIVILSICILPWLFPSMALAIGPPSGNPAVSNIKANINLRQPGDVLIYGEYNIPYTSIPGESADETYNIRLIDTDNTTQIGSILPYVRFDNGYNEGAFSFYFTASDNLTINQPYIIRISQNPAHFTSPQSYDYVIPISSWTSYATQVENSTELAINIISIAERLEAAHSGKTLLEASPGGTILSSPGGETYFRGVIYGIQSMAPELFLVQIYSYDVGDRAWATTRFDIYEARFSGEWVGTATENTSATFGMTTSTLMSLIYGLPIILGAVIICAIKFHKIEPAYLIGSIVIILLALMGWMSLALFATIYQLLAIYIGYLWFYARSS